MLAWLNLTFYKEFFNWNVKQIGIHVNEALDDIKQVLDGNKPDLAIQLQGILGDGSGFPKLSTVQAHLETASAVFSLGVSNARMDTWLNTKAKGAVVC